MPEPRLAAPSGRLLSLDVFRGVTIAGMILVNSPGDWGQRYGPLKHAVWHGWTPTDLVFPFFLFIVGVAIPLSFDRRMAAGQSRLRLFKQVVRRSIILFALGLIMYGFGDWRLIAPYIGVVMGTWLLFRDRSGEGFQPVPHEGAGLQTASSTAASHPMGFRWTRAAGLIVLAASAAWWVLDFNYFHAPHPPATAVESAIRIPGVLQRIAVCYFFAALIVLGFGIRGRALWAVALIAGYWLIVRYLSPPAGYEPGFTGRPEGLLHDWLDLQLLSGHLYSERPDPEGILSTLPAIATTLLGVLAGNWLQSARDARDKTAGLFVVANVLLVAGLWMSVWFPINKKIWTSSYVVFSAGMALHFLAMCWWLVDVKGWRRPVWPFVVFGTNAILVFFASGIVGRLLNFYKLTLPDGSPASGWDWLRQTFTGFPASYPQGTGMPLRRWIYEQGFLSWIDEPLNASLAFAVIYVFFWLLVLIPLYHKRVFLRV